MKKTLLFFFLVFSISAFSQTVGFFYSNAGALGGYILFAPTSTDSTYLIDKCGKRIHSWGSDRHPGEAAYILENGDLLRCGKTNNSTFTAGGSGGMIQKYDWDGLLLWQYEISSTTECQHHDAIQLPNGNILAIVWESYTGTEAENNGRNPTTVGNSMWSEKLIEIQPTGPTSGSIVWIWRVWDHLIQDYDPNKANYGVVADHPELFDINLGGSLNQDEDWLHFNGLDYNDQLDQILISSRYANEVFIIDHSTTVTEAASHSGGNSGKGGDILYRWGNPKNYKRGTSTDQKFYAQHNPQWIPYGFPMGGSFSVFNNGVGRPGGNYSSVEIFTPPQMVNYTYPIDAIQPFEPNEQYWIYTANPPSSLYTSSQGGAQRLENGNMIICEANSGNFTEVDSFGNDMWKYINPIGVIGATTQGNNPVQNGAFRSPFYPSDYAGFTGKVLAPGAPLEINPLNYTCVNLPTGINETAQMGEPGAYPNPFHNSFVLHIPFELNNAVMKIHDITGKLIYEEHNMMASPGSDHPISLPDYKGMIILSLHDASGNIWNLSALSK